MSGLVVGHGKRGRGQREHFAGVSASCCHYYRSHLKLTSRGILPTSCRHVTWTDLLIDSKTNREIRKRITVIEQTASSTEQRTGLISTPNTVLQLLFFAMARPQPDSRVDSQSPAQHHTCRMEVLRRDARPNGGTQQILQSRRRRTVATQTCSAAAPVISTQDTATTADSSQQEDPLRDSGTEQERLYPSRRQQPLPDLLPESSSSSAQSSRRGSVADEESVAEEQVVGRVAIQLRTIGDEINAVFLQRRNEAAHWQNWRGLYRGLVVFLADTISTLYQLR